MNPWVPVEPNPTRNEGFGGELLFRTPSNATSYENDDENENVDEEQSGNESSSNSYENATNYEDEASSNDSATQDDTFQRRALLVPPLDPNFNPNAVPQNGEEFLMHTIYERQRCPAVVTKRKPEGTTGEVSTQFTEIILKDKKLFEDSGAFSCKMSDDWKDLQIKDFEEMRTKVLYHKKYFAMDLLPNAELEPNIEIPTDCDNYDRWKYFLSENPPRMRILLRLSQFTLLRILNMFPHWLSINMQPDETSPPPSKRKTNDNTAQCSRNACALKLSRCDLSSSEEWMARWLYAVFACLQLPIQPNVHSTLREIARKCLRLRDLVPQPCDPEKVMPYSLIIWLISKYFGQMDFSEYI